MKLPTPATLAMISTARSTFQLNSKESLSPVRKFGKIGKNDLREGVKPSCLEHGCDVKVVLRNLFDSLSDCEVYWEEGAEGGDGYSCYITPSYYSNENSQYRQVRERTYQHDNRSDRLVQLVSQAYQQC